MFVFIFVLYFCSPSLCFMFAFSTMRAYHSCMLDLLLMFDYCFCPPLFLFVNHPFSHYQLCQSDHHQPTLAMLQSRGGSLCSCLVPTGRLWRYHKFEACLCACLVYYHKYQPDNSVNLPCHLSLDLNQRSLNLMSGPLPSEPTRQPRWSLEKLFVLCIKNFLTIYIYIYINIYSTIYLYIVLYIYIYI